MKKKKELIRLINSDLYRCVGKITIKDFISNYFFNAGYKYLFWHRCTRYFKENRYYKYSLFPISWLMLRHYMYKFGIGIPYTVKLGYGIKINHFTGIIVNSKCILGNNVTICQGVTMGMSERGNKVGCPIVGNNVFIGPGAIIFGKIRIGNNVCIGANTIVNFDIEDNSVVSSQVGKVVSCSGAEGYLKNQYNINELFQEKYEVNKHK